MENLQTEPLKAKVIEGFRDLLSEEAKIVHDTNVHYYNGAPTIYLQYSCNSNDADFGNTVHRLAKAFNKFTEEQLIDGLFSTASFIDLYDNKRLVFVFARKTEKSLNISTEEVKAKLNSIE